MRSSMYSGWIPVFIIVALSTPLARNRASRVARPDVCEKQDEILSGFVPHGKCGEITHRLVALKFALKKNPKRERGPLPLLYRPFRENRNVGPRSRFGFFGIRCIAAFLRKVFLSKKYIFLSLKYINQGEKYVFHRMIYINQ